MAGAAATAAASAPAPAARAGRRAPPPAAQPRRRCRRRRHERRDGSAGAAAAKLSPAAKRVVEENRLDPKTLIGSGRDGRVSKSDVVNYLQNKDAAPRPRRPRAGSGRQSGAAPAAPAAPSARGARAEQRVPMTRLRARIAERMVQAQATQALLTSFNEVDLHAVNELRARYKEAFEKQHGVKLGFMSFFAKACVEALKRFPVVNASVDGSDIVYHEYFDIGIAVSTDRGLIVPILRDADQMSFAEIEKSIAQFRRARARWVHHDRGADRRHVHHHQRRRVRLAAVDAHRQCSAERDPRHAQDSGSAGGGRRPGRVRPMMYLALTYDHRIIDGREAVQFLVTVKQCLEDPATDGARRMSDALRRGRDRRGPGRLSRGHPRRHRTS